MMDWIKVVANDTLPPGVVMLVAEGAVKVGNFRIEGNVAMKDRMEAEGAER
jgi:hypothetical protein